MDYITLQNKDNHKIIEGVLMYPLKVNRDESGILIETLRKDWPGIYGGDREFAMQYMSVTEPRVARDESVWHYHPTSQEDRFLVAYGEIITAVADNREGSETEGILNLFHQSLLWINVQNVDVRKENKILLRFLKNQIEPFLIFPDYPEMIAS